MIFSDLSERLDKSVQSIPRIDKKRKVIGEIPDSMDQMKFIIEDLTDRKSQLAINAYDIIDQHIRVVDEEIRLLETAILLSGNVVPPPPDFSNTGNGAATKSKAEVDVQYCLCRGPSRGNMISCENESCPIEWFHYECVGLKVAPKVWYCRDCSKKRKRAKVKS
jgi:inhibitor of growth protein 4